MTPPPPSSEWSRAIEAFPRLEPGHEPDPSAEELAEIAARAAEVRASEEFRSRHVPSERRQGISHRSWDGGKSGTARRYAGLGRDSDPEHVAPTSPAEAARRAIRDYRRATGHSNPKEPPIMSTPANATATANGTATDRECFECGNPTAGDGLCRNPICPKCRKPPGKPVSRPLPAPDADADADADAPRPSKYRGVSFSSNSKTRPWRAQIGVGGKPRTIGHYVTEEEAARAYDRECRQLGRLAKLNFPDDAPAPPAAPAPAPRPPAPAPHPVAPSPRRDDRAARPASPPFPALRRLDMARRVVEILGTIGDPAEVAAVLDMARAAMIGGDR